MWRTRLLVGGSAWHINAPPSRDVVITTASSSVGKLATGKRTPRPPDILPPPRHLPGNQSIKKFSEGLSGMATERNPLIGLLCPPGAFWNSAIRPSVCPTAQLSHCRPPEMCGRTSAAISATVELPSAKAYRLAAPGAIQCVSRYRRDMIVGIKKRFNSR